MKSSAEATTWELQVRGCRHHGHGQGTSGEDDASGRGMRMVHGYHDRIRSMTHRNDSFLTRGPVIFRGFGSWLSLTETRGMYIPQPKGGKERKRQKEMYI